MNLAKKTAVLSAAILTVAATAFGANTVEFQIGSTAVNVENGQIERKSSEVAPYVKNERTMVPLRIFSEALGCSVEWNEENNSATVKNAENTVVFTENSNTMTVNGKTMSLEISPEISGERMFIPLRAVSESLGYGVYYVSSTEHILIDAKNPVMKVSETEIPFCAVNGIYTLNGGNAAQESQKKSLAEYAYNFSKNVYAVTARAREAGFTLSEGALAQLSELGEALAEEPADGVLVGSIMKVQEDYVLAQEYINYLKENIQISQEELDALADEYVCAKHILISFSGRTEKEAQSMADTVYKLSKKGEDFDELIEKYGEDPGMEQYPDGYLFTKGMMVEEFEKAVYSMQIGEISKPVKTQYGYHIIYRLPTENKGELKEQLVNEKLDEVVDNIYKENVAEELISVEDFLGE